MMEYCNRLESNEFSEGLEKKVSVTEAEKAYISEVLETKDSTAIVARIDELSSFVPPKAIDSNKEIASLLESASEDISSIYLEAPQDSIQIKDISEEMKSIEGLDFDDWKESSFNERMSVLQKLEDQISVIAHRPSCELATMDLNNGHFGYYSNNSNLIVINNDIIESNTFNDYREALDTLVHEGRHAYQNYNLYEREVHPRDGDISNWKLNEFSYGYQDAEHFGFKAYALQPLEADARAFAEDVLNEFLKNRI